MEDFGLTLTPQVGDSAPEFKESEILKEDLFQTKLSEKELNLVHEFAKSINLNDTAQIIQYGSVAQKKVSDFSSKTLDSVRAKDMGEVGKMLTDLVVNLKGFSPDQKKGFLFGKFENTSNKIKKLKATYDSMEKNVDRVSDQLELQKITLLKDVVIFDKMYATNLDFYKELNMYILAGQERLSTVDDELKILQEKAKSSGLPEDAQAVNDFSQACGRFEKKLHDLELTRQICIQLAPQIRLLQNNNSIMAEKIQSTLINTIPLWKNQMVLSMGLIHSSNATKVQKAVSDASNDLLRKNADMLKTGSIDVAKESERAIIDIESVSYVNKVLIETFDDIIKIYDKGKENRNESKKELMKLEEEIKTTLINGGSSK